ncbi:unnamed protein product [Rhizoctonia solani]|uniref:Uncharacterized protein n=1 Tax=Rhizoctonia solani TaxID=456999 RepID=A0A8H3D0A3_9AGAM|nr:unnamed protein product [Rhizoctonia solani]
MSKRKITAGGYEDSGDDSELEPAIPKSSVKKVKPDSLVLPRSSAPNSEQSNFPPPFGRSSSFSSRVDYFPTVLGQAGSLRGASVSAPMTAKALAPGTGQHPISFKGDSFYREQEGPYTPTNNPPPVDTQGKKPVLKLCTDNLSTQSVNPRPTIVIERRFDEVITKFEECQQSWDQQHQQTQEKLTMLLDAVQLLTPTNLSPAHGPGSGTATPAVHLTLESLVTLGEVVPWRYNHLSNPPPPPGFLDLVTRACNSNTPRREFEGATDLSIKVSQSKLLVQVCTYRTKNHVRMAYTSSVGVKRIKDVRAHFEDQDGTPDTLPEHFVDPETRYGQPCPHNVAPLVRQIDWVPTWLQRCKGTIPNDQSELSLVLRSLTDEEWVGYLHSGPFKSAQQAWRNLGKTDEELQVMQTYQIMYHKTERKAFMRVGYIHSIPALRGRQYAFLCNRGYMSEEEEENGVIVVKRPTHRSSWINNLYDAISTSETRKQLKSRPGFTVKPREIRLIDARIPRLEGSNDKKKSAVQIALCAIPKRWKQQNSIEFSKATHLVDICNLYDAILTSETRKQLKSRPGSTVKPRVIRFIDAPIPQLEGNNDKKKTTVQIPICAISKGWKQQNSIELSKAAHLIDARFKFKPDISDFLARNPIVSDGELAGSSIKVEKANQLIDKASDTNDSISSPGSEVNEQSQDEGGDYVGGAQTEVLIDVPVPVTPPPSLSIASAEASIVPQGHNTTRIPIDPQLPGAYNSYSDVVTTPIQANTLEVHTFEPARSNASVLVQEPPDLGDIITANPTYAEYPPPAPPMLPPPPLQPAVETDQLLITGKNGEQRKAPQRSVGPAKKADPKSNTGVEATQSFESYTGIGPAAHTELHAGGTSFVEPQAPVKRGRGRPRGSKNRPKLIAED